MYVDRRHINPEEDLSISTKLIPSSSCQDNFTQNWKCQLEDGDICSVDHCENQIHLEIVEIFQIGPKWSLGQMNSTVPRAVLVVWLNIITYLSPSHMAYKLARHPIMYSALYLQLPAQPVMLYKTISCVMFISWIFLQTVNMNFPSEAQYNSYSAIAHHSVWAPLSSSLQPLIRSVRPSRTIWRQKDRWGETDNDSNRQTELCQNRELQLCHSGMRNYKWAS